MLDNDYNFKNSYIFVYTGWFCSDSEASVHCHEMFKKYALSLVSNLQSLERLVYSSDLISGSFIYVFCEFLTSVFILT
jgi:hypothetical protein